MFDQYDVPSVFCDHTTMSQFFEIHPDNPQQRLIYQAVKIINQGGVVVYPTDSCYALGCHLDDKAAMERIRRIRRVGKEHHFTLMSKDLSQVSTYAKINNDAYRLIKGMTPGPYTFILPATHEVPRRLWHPKKKTIGIRIPDNQIALALMENLEEPLMSSTLILPDTDMPMTDPYQIRVLLEQDVDLVIDGGFCGIEPSTVIGLTGDVPEVFRTGKGATDWLGKH